MKRFLKYIFIFIILNGCVEPNKEYEFSNQEEKVESGSLDQIQTRFLTTRDTVSRIFSSFSRNVDLKNLEATRHSKRIDRILSNRIKVINLGDFNSLKIYHKDLKSNYFLGEVTVPKDFNIQSLNRGWICSIRDNDNVIDGKLAIYYPNFIEMYVTTYKAGLQLRNNNVYDSIGEIMINSLLDSE